VVHLEQVLLVDNRNNMQRRNFLKAMGILAGGVILSACQRLLGKSTPELQPTDIPPSGTPTASQTPSPTTTDTPKPTASPTKIPSLTSTPTPNMVTLLEPVDGSQLPASGRVRFAWQPWPGAQGYDLQICRQGTVLTSLKTKLSQIDIYLEYLPWAGEYTWQVIARDPNGDTLAVSLPWSFRKSQTTLPSKTSTPGGSGAGVEPTDTPGGGPGSAISGTGTPGGG
jgi:hypothetical protein